MLAGSCFCAFVRSKPETEGDLTSGTRESQILRFAALGYTDKEIAEKLSLSPNTIYTYWRRVRARYGSSSRGESISRYLHDSFDHFRQIVESLPDAVLIVQRGIVCFASPAAKTLLDRDPNRLVGQSVDTCIDTSTLSVSDDRNVRFGTDNSSSGIALARHANGSKVSVSLSCMPIQWQGKPASLTLLRRSEPDQSLEDSLRAGLLSSETLPDSMAILSADGICLDWRSSAMNIVGDTVGRHFRDIVPASLSLALDSALMQLREGRMEVEVNAEGHVARCSLMRLGRILVLVRSTS